MGAPKLLLAPGAIYLRQPLSFNLVTSLLATIRYFTQLHNTSWNSIFFLPGNHHPCTSDALQRRQANLHELGWLRHMLVRNLLPRVPQVQALERLVSCSCCCLVVLSRAYERGVREVRGTQAQ